jgi:uncharacterized protein DUF3108
MPIPIRISIAFAAVLSGTSAKHGGAQAPALPFEAGERLRYSVSVGKLGAVGEGEMSVDGPVEVRGTPALVLRSEMHAKVAFLKSAERAESWIDPTRMAALRFQKQGRGTFSRGSENVELFPEDQRWEDEHGKTGQTPTSAPLDELSFIYYLRTLPLTSDTCDTFVRHYDPARNPIAVRVLGRDTVRTRAGTFATIVVEMRVKDRKRYSGEGTIRLHLSDDAFRYPVRIESAVPVLGTTVLTLESYSRPTQRLAGGAERQPSADP